MQSDTRSRCRSVGKRVDPFRGSSDVTTIRRRLPGIPVHRRRRLLPCVQSISRRRPAMRVAPLLVVPLVLAIVMLPGFGQPPVERVDTSPRLVELVPFTLSVGRYYLLVTPDNRPIPS